MPPKIVDRARRKRELALIALEIFSEKGFESASIRHIAEAAGIGKGTVYEYFESKEELIHASAHSSGSPTILPYMAEEERPKVGGRFG